MNVHCKNCGAVVVGKFCSCCGQRVTTILEDFRLAERRAAREFKNKHHEEDFHTYGLIPDHVASLSFFVAEEKCVPSWNVYSCSFDEIAEESFNGLENAVSTAEKLYKAIMNMIFPDYS